MGICARRSESWRFASREAAESARLGEIERREAKPEPAVPEPVVAEPTFSEYFKYWMEEHAARRCAPKTLERYQDLGRYLAKHLGDTRINELTTAQIQHAIHRLKDAGGQTTKEFPNGRPLAPKTVRHVGTLLYTALAEAFRMGMLKIPHPMANKRVVLPKLPKRGPPVLDKEKLRALFERARGTRLYPLVVLASATGCRRGELLASNGAIWMNPPAKSTSRSRWNRRRQAFGSRARSQRSRGISRFPSGRSKCCARIGRNRMRTVNSSALATRITNWSSASPMAPTIHPTVLAPVCPNSCAKSGYRASAYIPCVTPTPPAC